MATGVIVPMTEIRELRNEVDSLRGEIRELRASITALVDAWRLATGLLKAIKIIATLAGGITAFLTLLHFGPKGH